MLRDIARELGNVPRDATESWPDMFHYLRRVKGRVLVVAERVDREEDRGPRIGASTKVPPGLIRSAREALYRRRSKQKPRSLDQLEMALLS